MKKSIPNSPNKSSYGKKAKTPKKLGSMMKKGGKAKKMC